MAASQRGPSAGATFVTAVARPSPAGVEPVNGLALRHELCE